MCTVAEITCTVATVAACAMRVEVEIKQSGYVRVRDEADRPAFATICTIWAGKRLKLFTLYRDTAVSSIARAKVKRHLVNK
jgi:hypothetical protein